jgi:hypothetical protein
MDLNALQPGHVLVDEPLAVPADVCAAYRDAVEDCVELHVRERIVPSMAAAALALSAILRAIELPAGTVHTSQEVEFVSAIAEGAGLHTKATVMQNSVRRGTRFLALDFVVSDSEAVAVRGRTSLAVAEASA